MRARSWLVRGSVSVLGLGLVAGLGFWGRGWGWASDDPPGGGREVIPHNQDRAPNPAYGAEEAARRMTVPAGFTVEVVASEPDLVNPVAMTIDERGRFWVAESLEYPRRSAGAGRDRIKVLEDTDGDGRADKVTVFAEGLNIPSGIAVGAGGVWVANAPDLLFMRDKDGDGRADEVEVVLTGFGRDDTHELPNSLTWGPDGWLYGLNGVFNPSRIEYRGRTYEFTCAMFRLNPRTREFEVFAEGTSNPWGIAWNAEGDAFLSACVIDHLWHLTETGYYLRQGGPYPAHVWRMGSIVDYRHQKAAYCGIHYFDSAAYPAEYRGKLYMGNIHGGCLNVDEATIRGATYKGSPREDFLTANDSWFMPVAQRTGPDGSLYVLDWYDRYHCYQDANRDPEGIDRLRGRLYRVRYKDTPRVFGFDRSKESDEALIGRLGDANVYERETARRLLTERNRPETRERLETLALDPGASREARLNALWTLIGTGRLDPDFHLTVLDHPDPAFRSWGVRAIGSFEAGAPSAFEELARRTPNGRSPVVSRVLDGRVLARVLEMIGDPNPRVAAQVAIVSRKLPGADPAAILGKLAIRGEDDPILPHIVWENLHPHLPGRGEAFLSRAMSGAWKDSPIFGRLLPRLGELLEPKSAGRLLDALTEAGRGDWAGDLAGALLDRARVASREARAAWLEALGDAAGRLEGMGGDAGTTGRLLGAALGRAESLAAARARLRSGLGEMGDGEFGRTLETLAALGDGALPELASERLTDRGVSTVRRRALLAALSRYDSVDAGAMVASKFGDLEPELRPNAVELLTQRPAWGRALLEGIESGSIPRDAVNLNQARRLQGSGDEVLAERARGIWGLIREGRNPERELVIAAARRTLARTPGDRAAGAAVFERLCAQCHLIHGKGQEVGPDVTVNGRSSYEQLLSNILDPNLVIGEGYLTTTVLTTDGRALSGLKVEDTADRVSLKLQGGKLERIPRGEIEEMTTSEVSLMPENLETQMTTRELADLIEFLSWDLPPGAEGAKRLPDAPARD